MKLLNSLIVTAIIVLAFWSVAVFQPQAATKQTAATATKTHPTTKPAKPKSSSFGPIKLVGITKSVELQKVSEIWMDFHDNSALHEQLTAHPDKVYVYYRNFSQDYQSATVTIGYANHIVNQVKPTINIAKQTVEPLLTKSSYSNTELANVWQTIDYRQPPQGLLEIHYLDKKGNTTASEVLLVK